MDELTGLCLRLLGDKAAAAQTAAEAGAADGRVGQLARALELCRAARDDMAPTEQPAASAGNETGLARAVARELRVATTRLPQRQQEALALRELLGLSHELVAEVLGIEPAAATALLARSRTRLLAELRGVRSDPAGCLERDRMVRTATLRQDGQPVSIDDDDWLIEHLGHCDGCRRLHATMLEASVCYRGWPVSLSDGDSATPGNGRAAVESGPRRATAAT